MLFLCSYYLQRTLGYSTLRSGFAFLPLGVVAILVTAPATRIMHKAGPRPVYLAQRRQGSVLGLILLTQAPQHGTYLLHLLPALLILGASCSAAASPSTCTASPTSPPASRASPPASWSPPSRSAPPSAWPPSPPAP